MMLCGVCMGVCCGFVWFFVFCFLSQKQEVQNWNFSEIHYCHPELDPLGQVCRRKCVVSKTKMCIHNPQAGPPHENCTGIRRNTSKQSLEHSFILSKHQKAVAYWIYRVWIHTSLSLLKTNSIQYSTQTHPLCLPCARLSYSFSWGLQETRQDYLSLWGPQIALGSRDDIHMADLK